MNVIQTITFHTTIPRMSSTQRSHGKDGRRITLTAAILYS
jgi:hypothetical protein